MHPNRSGPGPTDRRAPTDAGFSLVEVMIATVLLLIVAIAVLPLFTRAIESNTAGGRATAMTTYMAQDIEAFNQATVDHPDWEIAAGTSRVLPDQYLWVADEGIGDVTTGDEVWKTDSTGGGIYLWKRSVTVRKYSFADIIPGIISIDGTDLVPLGHPELFDTPLSSAIAEGPNAHFVEFRTLIKLHNEELDALPYDPDVFLLGQDMTVPHFRTY